MIPDTLQADPSFRADTRTDDEKDRDAINNWMRWQGYLGYLCAREASALRQAERGTNRLIWKDGRPTSHGGRVLNWLYDLADVVENEQRRFGK
jgi:hypothetical protein